MSHCVSLHTPIHFKVTENNCCSLVTFCDVNRLRVCDIRKAITGDESN